MFQGKRQEAAVKNSTFTFDPARIDAVVLSHAHGDHVGRIPLLWKKGYRNPVHCTYATKDLSDVMLQDSGYIQEKDEEFFRKHMRDSMMPSAGPMYTQADAIACMEIFQGKNYNEWFPVVQGCRAMFLEAGHIIGAAMVVLEIEDPTITEGPKGTNADRVRRIGFSGDIGRDTLPIIRDPAAMPPVEALLCESTYGNRTHDDIATARQRLAEVIIATARRGGKTLIPAFSLERTQEILYDLHVLWDEKAIPALPIVIDSPLAKKVTDVFMRHPECYDQDMFTQFLSKAHSPFQFQLVRYSETVDDSKALNGTPGPMVIMAGSGMCEAGRIRHHLKEGIEDPKNTVLAVGFMAEETLGRKILDPAISEVKIFDRMYRKNAQTEYINAYSGHADMSDLDPYVLSVDGLQDLILVHGEPEQMEPFAARMQHLKPMLKVHMPARAESVVV